MSYRTVGYEDERRRSVQSRYDSANPPRPIRRDADRDRSRDEDRILSRRDSDLAGGSPLSTRNSMGVDREADRLNHLRMAAQLPAKPAAPAPASAVAIPPSSPVIKAKDPSVQETFETLRRFGELVEKRTELKQLRNKKRMEMDLREREYLPYRDASRAAAFPSIVEWRQRVKTADEKAAVETSSRLRAVDHDWQQCLESIAREIHGHGPSTAAAETQTSSLSALEAKFADELNSFRQRVEDLESGRKKSDQALADMEAKYNTLESQQSHLTEENSNLRAIITRLRDDAKASEGSTQKTQKSIDELSIKMADTQARVKKLPSSIPDNIVEISQRFGSCVDELSSQRAEIERMHDDIKAQQEKHASLSTVVTDLDNNMFTVKSQIEMIDVPSLSDISKAWTKDRIYSKVKYHHDQLQNQQEELQSIHNDMQALKQNSLERLGQQGPTSASTETGELADITNALQQLQSIQAKLEADLTTLRGTQTKQYGTLKGLSNKMLDVCSGMIDELDSRVGALEAAPRMVDSSRIPAATPQLEARIASLESKAEDNTARAYEQQHLVTRVKALEDLKLGESLGLLSQRATASSESFNNVCNSTDKRLRLFSQTLNDLSQRIDNQMFSIGVLDQQLKHMNTKELADIIIHQLDQLQGRLGPRLDALTAADHDLHSKVGTLQGDYVKLKEDFGMMMRLVRDNAAPSQKRSASPSQRQEEAAKKQRMETNGRPIPNGRPKPASVQRQPRTLADG